MNADLKDTESRIISQRAAQWLVRLSAGGADDRAAFVRWLKKSPRHVEEFLLMSAVCKGLRGAGPGDMAGIEQLIAEAGSESSNVVPLAGTAMSNVVPRVDAAVDPENGATPWAGWPPVRRMPGWTGMAAGVAIFGLGAIWAIPRLTAFLNTYSTAVGEQRTVALPDGSVVYMNAQSRLRVNYSDAGRDLQLLGGEAAFKVEREASRPFRVHAAKLVIQALGTQFNVYSRPGSDTVVSVIDGAVRVSRPAAQAPAADSKAALRLGAGEEAQVIAGGEIVKRDRIDLSRATAWRERRLVFKADTLENIAAEFARYSPRLIVLSDAASRRKRITGTFDADDPASLIQFLERLDEFQVATTADRFVVTERPGGSQ